MRDWRAIAVILAATVVGCGQQVDAGGVASATAATEGADDLAPPDEAAGAATADAKGAEGAAEVTVCAQPPFGESPGPNPSPDEASVVGTLTLAHPDLFAGGWWDSEAQEFVFATVDLAAAEAVLAAELPATVARRIEMVPRNDQELAAIQARAPDLLDHGTQASSARRVWDALVEIDLPILDEPSLDAVRAVFGANLDAICVTGADPATVVPEGPQQPAGDGWRLLADQIQRGVPYSAHVAVNEAEYRSLWASLALEGQPPPVDFASDIVVHFGAVYSGSCPEIRLDGVIFDLDRSLVTADVVLPGGNRACTSDANPHAYLVAVPRDRLPALPFTVTAERGCPVCMDARVTDLAGGRDPVAPLSEVERWMVLRAVVKQRVTIDHSFGGQAPFTAVEVVDVLGRRHVGRDRKGRPPMGGVGEAASSSASVAPPRSSARR